MKAPHQSWSLFDQDLHFDWGVVMNSVITDVLEPETVGHLGPHHAGCWECDLRDNSLIWSGGVYDLFGLPRGSAVTRDEALSFYMEDSRAKMDKLRAYAIQHRRGFTLDVTLRPAAGPERSARLIAAPVLDGPSVARLHGLKFPL